MTVSLPLPPRLRLRARVPVAAAGRLAWTRRGDRLIVGARDATVIVDAAGGDEIERWPHAYAAFACGADDSCVAAGNARGYLDLWRFGRSRPGEPAARHGGAVTALAFSDDGGRIFSAGEDGQIGIWRAATLDASFVAVAGPARDLAWDGASDGLAVAVGRAGVVVLDGHGRARGNVARPPDRTTAVAWAGGLLFAGTRDGRLAAWDAGRLEPARATVDLGLGAIARLLPLGTHVAVEGADAIAVLDAAGGRELLRWTHGGARAGGSLAAHAGLRALAVAVPTGTAILDVDLDEPPARIVTEVLALYHPSDAALAGAVLQHLERAGARIRDAALEPRAVGEAARRGAVAVVLYGPSGPAPRHDYSLDVLATRGARVVPVILPGGAVPEPQRRFHGAAYVCFHERIQDDDALARVTRAVLR